MTQANYSIAVKSVTSINPQTYSKLERVHQTIKSTFKVQDIVLNDKNPRDGILASTMFALRPMVHIATQYTPAQLVFGQDSILNTRHKANWHIIKKRKQDLINKRNQQINRN